MGDDILIFLDGRLRRVDRRRRQDRSRLALDRHLRRGFVALRPFRLTDVLLLGLGRDRSQSNGESGACRRAKKCAARKPRDGPATHQLQISKNGRLSSRALSRPARSVGRTLRRRESLRRFDAQHRSHSGVFMAAPLTADKRQAGRSRKGRPARLFGLEGAERRRQSRYLIWSVQYRSRRRREAFIRAKSSPGMPPICSIVRACFS